MLLMKSGVMSLSPPMQKGLAGLSAVLACYKSVKWSTILYGTKNTLLITYLTRRESIASFDNFVLKHCW